MPELIKLLPEGSAVIAVIVVVLLFLKQQREQEKRLEGITAAFNQRILEVTQAFQSQIDRLAKQIFDDKQSTQIQMQKLFDSFMSLSRETVSAVVELKTAIHSLAEKVNAITVERRSSKRLTDKSDED